MKKVYHHFSKWEDFKCGFYRNVEPKQKKFFSEMSYALLKSPGDLRIAMLDVVRGWKYSTEEMLTNASINRRAWLGQAACAYFCRTPEDLTRDAWNRLTHEEQKKANSVANFVIKFWAKIYLKMPKRFINKDVYTAAKERISETFDNFEKVYV